jgi:hypothetical protein
MTLLPIYTCIVFDTKKETGCLMKAEVPKSRIAYCVMFLFQILALWIFKGTPSSSVNWQPKFPRRDSNQARVGVRVHTHALFGNLCVGFLWL